MKYTGTSTRASCHVYCIKHEDFSCYNYVFYITTTPYLPCNNRKGLYDFYYTAITLTTGYNNTILTLTLHQSLYSLGLNEGPQHADIMLTTGAPHSVIPPKPNRSHVTPDPQRGNETEGHVTFA